MTGHQTLELLAGILAALIGMMQQGIGLQKLNPLPSTAAFTSHFRIHQRAKRFAESKTPETAERAPVTRSACDPQQTFATVLLHWPIVLPVWQWIIRSAGTGKGIGSG